MPPHNESVSSAETLKWDSKVGSRVWERNWICGRYEIALTWWYQNHLETLLRRQDDDAVRERRTSPGRAAALCSILQQSQGNLRRQNSHSSCFTYEKLRPRVVKNPLQGSKGRGSARAGVSQSLLDCLASQGCSVLSSVTPEAFQNIPNLF